jgi:hypothetical protein
MKLMKLLFAAICLLGLVASGLAQTTETQKKTAVFGYMDPQTGLFHSLARTPLSPEEAAAITPTTGKFVFNVTITVNSALSTKAVIGCEVAGGVADLTTGEFSNVVAVTATRTGTTAKCTLTVPYSWDLATPAKDTVAFDLSVSATVGTFGSATFYNESFTAPEVTMKVPANGTTTTQDISTTI